jgi:hypothetical protein
MNISYNFCRLYSVVVDVINKFVGYMRGKKHGYMWEVRKQNAKLKMTGTGRKSDCRSH